LNAALPLLYDNKKVWGFYFNTWRHKYKKSQAEKQIKRTKMGTAFECIDRCQQRAFHYSFNVWRDKVVFMKEGVKQMARISFAH